VTGTLVALLRARVEATPDAVACGFSADGEAALETLTYSQLERQARAVAEGLAVRVAPGGRAVLVFEPGLGFVSAFFGCLYAGVAAVPVYPPAPPREAAGIAHLKHVARDCGAEVVLTSLALAGLASQVPELPSSVAGGDPDGWRDPGVRPGSLAMLQYTSGSTGTPRGVALTHANLVANLGAIHWFLRESDDCVMASWLPMYHDMGLIGTVLYPICSGGRAYLMSPLHFMQRPARWFELIERSGANMSGAPNFGYELCLARISAQERAAFDLSRVELLFNGAEPVRAATVRRFEEAFAAAGLRPRAVVPCYGMAEATLLVTGFRREDDPRTVVVDRDALRRDHVEPCSRDAPAAVELAACGAAPPGNDVRIVDRDGGELPERHVGEIWFRSASLSGGYWGRADCHSAALGGEGPFLRTGDLGFLHERQLFVTGRIKDLIVVRGRNIHPHEIEDVAAATPGARAGGGVAFALPTSAGEAVALVQETRRGDADELRALAGAIRGRVLERVGVAVEAVYLVPPRSVLKTSSGKPRRAATREALEAGALVVLHEQRAEALLAGSPGG
jgi:acyl-CoA synthetase (AMP-forming)/AMP-acid ligase II